MQQFEARRAEEAARAKQMQRIQRAAAEAKQRRLQAEEQRRAEEELIRAEVMCILISPVKLWFCFCFFLECQYRAPASFVCIGIGFDLANMPLCADRDFHRRR